MPLRHGRGQVRQIRAKSACIIALGISLEAADDPIRGSTTMDAPKSHAFSASKLLQCAACARANPPTRASCLYCGAALEISELNAFSPAPMHKAEPSSEVCFHVVAIPGVQIQETALNQLAELLNLKPSDLELLLAHPAGAPMFTVNSESQAQIAEERLHEFGVRTHCISDQQLALETASASVSALESRDDALVGTVGRNKQTVAASWDEITLIVIGRLYFHTKEIDQKRSRAQQVIDEREMLTDEAVLDIYARDSHGWRIRAGGFNFSCLGENKKLTTFENFTALISLLREHATTAVFDDSYVRLRGALDSVWPGEPVTSGKERRRSAFGDFNSSVTSIDNELQFTRYSRLVRYLHASRSEDHAAQT